MTPEELRLVAQTMREYGLTHVKTAAYELTMPVQELMKAKECPDLVPVDAPVAESNPIEHKVEALTSLLKLSDINLVDQLFPDTTEQEGAA